MLNDNAVSANDLIDAILSLPDQKQRLEELMTRGIINISERFVSHPEDLTDEQRWELHEKIETWSRRDRIRRFRSI